MLSIIPYILGLKFVGFQMKFILLQFTGRNTSSFFISCQLGIVSMADFMMLYPFPGKMQYQYLSPCLMETGFCSAICISSYTLGVLSIGYTCGRVVMNFLTDCDYGDVRSFAFFTLIVVFFIWTLSSDLRESAEPESFRCRFYVASYALIPELGSIFILWFKILLNRNRK